MVKKFFSIVCSVLLYVSPVLATYNPNSGTSATPGSIFYTPSQGSNGGVLSQQTKNQQTTFVTEWRNSSNVLPVCNDSNTNNSQSLVNAMNAANIVYVPANCLIAIDNVSIPSNTTIVCNNHSNNSGFIHLSTGTTTSLLKFNTGTFFGRIIGCTLNGNLVDSSAPLVNVNQASSITIQDDVFRSVGTSSLVRSIQVYQSSVDIIHNTAADGDVGTFAQIDFGGLNTRMVRVNNNNISGLKDNAIVMENSGGTSNSKPGMCYVEGNNIQNITSSFGDGQSGNGILLFQIWMCEVGNNITSHTAYSGIRVGQNAAFNDVYGNQLWYSLDLLYCAEEGGMGNKCHDNTLYASAGISSTNQGSKIIGIPDELYNNTCYAIIQMCIHAEGAIVHDDYAINSPVGFELGAGGTTGGNIVYRIHCIANQQTGSGGTPVSGLDLGNPMSVCVKIDPSTNSSKIERLSDLDLGSGWQIPIGIVGSNNFAGISNITNAVQAVVTLTGSDPSATVGAKACIDAVQSMIQANGYCPTILAVNGLNLTLDLDTTNFTPWVAQTGFPHINVYWSASGTPTATFGNTYLVRNTDIPFSMLAGMYRGSHVWVYDASCSQGTPVPAGTGVWVDKVSDTLFACVLNSDGTVNSPVGFNSGGSTPGQINMKSASGHTLTVTPQTGLSTDTTLPLPQ